MKKSFVKLLLVVMLFNFVSPIITRAEDSSSNQNQEQTTAQTMAEIYEIQKAEYLYYPIITEGELIGNSNAAKQKRLALHDEIYSLGFKVFKDGEEIENFDDIIESVEIARYMVNYSEQTLSDPVRKVQVKIPDSDGIWALYYSQNQHQPLLNNKGEKAALGYYKITYKDGSSTITGNLREGKYGNLATFSDFGINGSMMLATDGVKYFSYNADALQPKKQDVYTVGDEVKIDLENNLDTFFTDYEPNTVKTFASSGGYEALNGSFPPGTRIIPETDTLDTSTPGEKEVKVQIIFPDNNGRQEQIILERTLKFTVLDRVNPINTIESDFETSIEIINNLDNLEETLTEEIKKEIEEIKRKAEEAINKAQTQEDIDRIKDEAEKAISDTIKWASEEDFRKELQKAIDTVSDLDYTNADEEQKNEYDTALEAARAIEPIDEENATIDDINAYVQKIAEAKENLRKNGLGQIEDEEGKRDYLNGREKMDEAVKTLEEKIAELEDIKKLLDYTNADETLQEKYVSEVEKAKEILEDLKNNPEKYPTQAEIDKAIEAINKAKEDLNGNERMEEIKNSLEEELKLEEETLNSDNYKKADEEKQKAYDEALENAKKILEEAEKKLAKTPENSTENLKTQEEVEKALEKLEEARKALNGENNIKTAEDELDKKKEEAIEEINKLENLTDEEKQEKIKEVEKLIEDAKKEISEIDRVEGEDPKTKIDEIVEKTIPSVDDKIIEAQKDDLQKIVDKEEDIKNSVDYTNADEELKTAYDEVLEKANEVIDNPDSTSEEIAEALENLKTAEENLNGDEKLAAAKEELKKEADKENDVTNSVDYTNADEDKKKAYDDALENAKNILDDENSTQEQVEKALEDLKKATEDLNGDEKLAAAKEELKKEADKENDVTNSVDYTNADEDKKKAYDDALENAKNILDDENSTQEQVEKALEDLKKATEDLNGDEKLAAAKEELKKEIEKENNVKNTIDYTNSDEDKKQAYDDALENAKNILDDENSTQEQVDNAKKLLEETTKNLNGDEKLRGSSAPSTESLIIKGDSRVSTGEETNTSSTETKTENTNNNSSNQEEKSEEKVETEISEIIEKETKIESIINEEIISPENTENTEKTEETIKTEEKNISNEKINKLPSDFEAIAPIEINNKNQGLSEINTYVKKLPKTGAFDSKKAKVDVKLKSEDFRLAGSRNPELEYWLQVLPQQDKNSNKYIVLPSQGLVMPINDVEKDEKAYKNFVNGIEENFYSYLKNGSVELPGTSTNGYGEIGNKVIAGHSSYWANSDTRYRTHFQKIIKMEKDQEIWVYEKNKNGNFDRYVYKVTESYNTSETDISVLKPTNKANLTLFTCTPIGGTAGRWIVKSEFIGN